MSLISVVSTVRTHGAEFGPVSLTAAREACAASAVTALGCQAFRSDIPQANNFDDRKIRGNHVSIRPNGFLLLEGWFTYELRGKGGAPSMILELLSDYYKLISYLWCGSLTQQGFEPNIFLAQSIRPTPGCIRSLPVCTSQSQLQSVTLWSSRD
jgi:hypothetical protein